MKRLHIILVLTSIVAVKATAEEPAQAEPLPDLHSEAALMFCNPVDETMLWIANYFATNTTVSLISNIPPRKTYRNVQNKVDETNTWDGVNDASRRWNVDSLNGSLALMAGVLERYAFLRCHDALYNSELEDPYAFTNITTESEWRNACLQKPGRYRVGNSLFRDQSLRSRMAYTNDYVRNLYGRIPYHLLKDELWLRDAILRTRLFDDNDWSGVCMVGSTNFPGVANSNFPICGYSNEVDRVVDLMSNEDDWQWVWPSAANLGLDRTGPALLRYVKTSRNFDEVFESSFWDEKGKHEQSYPQFTTSEDVSLTNLFVGTSLSNACDNFLSDGLRLDYGRQATMTQLAHLMNRKFIVDAPHHPATNFVYTFIQNDRVVENDKWADIEWVETIDPPGGERQYVYKIRDGNEIPDTVFSNETFCVTNVIQLVDQYDCYVAQTTNKAAFEVEFESGYSSDVMSDNILISPYDFTEGVTYIHDGGGGLRLGPGLRWPQVGIIYTFPSGSETETIYATVDPPTRVKLRQGEGITRTTKSAKTVVCRTPPYFSSAELEEELMFPCNLKRAKRATLIPFYSRARAVDVEPFDDLLLWTGGGRDSTFAFDLKFSNDELKFVDDNMWINFIKATNRLLPQEYTRETEKALLSNVVFPVEENGPQPSNQQILDETVNCKRFVGMAEGVEVFHHEVYRSGNGATVIVWDEYGEMHTRAVGLDDMVSVGRWWPSPGPLVYLCATGIPSRCTGKISLAVDVSLDFKNLKEKQQEQEQEQ